MVFVAASGAIGAWIPQRANLTPQRMAEWEAANPGLSHIAGVAGFDHLFSTWWFLSVLGVFSVMLLAALWGMIRAALGRAEALVPRTAVPQATLSEVKQRAEAAGYVARRAPAGMFRYVRRDAGAWAPAVLHLGMLVAVVAGLVASALTSRAVLDLSQGEVHAPGDAYLAAEADIFGNVPDLGSPVRFDGVRTDSWSNGELKTMAASIAMFEDGEWITHTSSVNEPLRYRGHTVYVQPADFGDAAFLVVTDPDGVERRLRMEFALVQGSDVAYGAVAIDGETVLHGRWDPRGVRGEDLLALRPDADPSADPVPLSEGAAVTVGRYAVELVSTGQWARFIVVRPRAVGVLFAGFAIIAIGSLMLYLYVPRELVVEEADGVVRYAWRAARFGASYLHERDAIIRPPGGGAE